jgi:hypothetical protein
MEPKAVVRMFPNVFHYWVKWAGRFVRKGRSQWHDSRVKG